MMDYDDCENCNNDKHKNCQSDPVYLRFICTCPVCNALVIANIDWNDELEKSTMLSQLNSLKYHINEMTENQWKTFKTMVKE
jgi:hypothetical protein